MSSNTNIGNTPVNQGYVQLIHTGETGGIDGTLRTLYDGDGTASDLQIASNKVKISTELYIGSKTITEYVQDVVGDMFDTNGSHTNITATYDDNGDGAIDLVATGAISGITGGTGIDATGSGNITIAIDSTVATLTGTQTLTNKTLASPTFTGDIDFTDASTPVLRVTDTTNTTTTIIQSANSAGKVGTSTNHNFNIVRNNVAQILLQEDFLIINNSGNDLDVNIKDSSANSLFRTDAANSRVGINDATPSYTLDVNGTGRFTGAVQLDNNLTITGDLQVNGTTTTVNQTNLDVSDNIIGLNRGASSNANDSGLIIERGSTGNNVFIGWKETNDRVLFGTTLAEADDTGDLTITDADIQANRLYGDVTGNVTGSLSGGTVTSLSSPIALSEGGTGGGSDSEARTNLGLAIGTDVQAYNSTLASVAGGTYTGDDSITTLGTIGTGVWQGTAIASAYLDADTAHLSGTQTFSGAKTFSSTITGSITGNAGTATALATARSITMSGEVSSGAVNFDGTAGVVIPNTTIGSGVIVNGSIASDAAIATSKLASNTISGVALGSNLNALTVGTGMAFASGSNYTGATARQINLNLSAIDHDSLGNYVDNEHIDWTTDQGAINIHAGNYTDTNQLTTFVIQDGDTTNVTISQGKYVKFQALTNGGLDIDWASSLGAGSSGDPYDLQFKIDLSNMGALVDTLESGDNLLVYNADEGTALAPVSEIQSALNIPSASGTTDGVVTLNANGTLTGESGLTYDTSTLAVTGDQTLSGVLKHSSNGSNRLTLDDDSDASVTNQVTLAGVNNVNILIDGTNNGTGDFQIRSRPTTANDLDTADIIVDIDETTATFDNITSQQFQIGTANRFKIQEEGAFVQNGSLGVGLTPIGSNARIQASSHIEAGVGSGAIGLTINDGGGNSNVTFNHTGRVPEQNGNSGRIEVNTDGIGNQYMAFELAGNVTSGVTVATTEIARINSTGLQSSLSGTAASPALRVNDSDTGLYRIADDKLGISTAGTFAVAVDASQNVGIGTNSPSKKLHIKDSTNEIVVLESSDANADIVGADTGGSTRFRSQSGSLDFYTGGSASNASASGSSFAMRIDTSQRVGIGTTTPSGKLDVQDNTGSLSSTKNITAEFYRFDATYNPRLQIRHSTSGTNIYHTYSTTAGLLTFGNGGTVDAMAIDSSGSVGIGTTSPLSKLHIEESTNDADALMIRQTAGGSGSVQGKVHIGMNHFNSTNPSVRITAEELDVADYRGNLAFSTRAGTSDVAPTEKMRITHDGLVGIGTTSPGYKLSVENELNVFSSGDTASPKVEGHLLRVTDTTNDNPDIEHFFVENHGLAYGMRWLYDGGANTFSLFRHDNSASGNEVLRFNRANSNVYIPGNVGIGTNSPTSKLHIFNGDGSIPDDANNHLLIEDDGHSYLGIGGGTSSDTGIHFMDSGGIRGRIAYHHNGDSMSFKTSNTERIRIDATGTKFSENFSATDDILHINPANGHNRTMELAGDAINVFFTGGTTSTTLKLNEDGGDIITGAGNVGIGTGSPAQKLHISGNTMISNGSYYMAEDADGDDINLLGIHANNNVYIGASNNAYAGGFMLYGAASTTSGHVWYSGNAEAMRIDSSQNVGIGQVSPGYKLDVSGTGRFTGVITASGGIFTNGSSLGYTSDGYSRASSGNASVPGFSFASDTDTGMYKVGANKLGFTSGGTLAMMVDSNQNVGIGVASPADKLHVDGSIRINDSSSGGLKVGTSQDLQIYHNGTNSFGADNYTGILLYQQRTQDSHIQFRLNEGGTIAEKFRMEADGDFHAHQDVIAYSTTPSDKKLKTNIKDIEYGLDTIMKLNPKEYDWKKDNRHDIGFIAQEVEEVIPEIVKDKKHFDKEIKTLDYEKLTAVLIKAVQEQQEQINELKEKLNG